MGEGTMLKLLPVVKFLFDKIYSRNKKKSNFYSAGIFVQLNSYSLSAKVKQNEWVGSAHLL